MLATWAGLTLTPAAVLCVCCVALQPAGRVIVVDRTCPVLLTARVVGFTSLVVELVYGVLHLISAVLDLASQVLTSHISVIDLTSLVWPHSHWPYIFSDQPCILNCWLYILTPDIISLFIDLVLLLLLVFCLCPSALSLVVDLVLLVADLTSFYTYFVIPT